MPLSHTRIAPTPSGYLHLGNAWSFLLTWLAARREGGTVLLRIDDLDAARFREEYLQDIFDSLHWLGLNWDEGPRDVADFHASHSQRLRIAQYQRALNDLRQAGRVYACRCSREEIRQAAQGGMAYPGTCRELGLDLDEPGLAWRFRASPALELGDFVLRQKNGDPAYQLASVVDDVEMEIGLVVRGMDLKPSTEAQLELAQALGHDSFPRTEFRHHGLWVDGEGHKLSKSADAFSLRALRERFPDSAPLYRGFARLLGQNPAHGSRAEDLLSDFSWDFVPPGPFRFPDFLAGLRA